jgi:hypothetical protein
VAVHGRSRRPKSPAIRIDRPDARSRSEQAFVAVISQADAEIRDLSVTEPTRETVVLELTGKEYRE